MQCAACRQPAAWACGRCRLTAYCGEACAARDWPRHLLGDHEGDHDELASLVLAPDATHAALYVGGLEALQHLDGVGAVVSVLPADEARLRTLVGTRPWRHYQFRDRPEAPIHEAFDDSARFIEAQLRAGRGVLVHCAAGISRSVTLAANYMVRHRGFSVDGALAHIRARRPQAGPNDGFVQQLREFSASNY
jgi:hypothetical protein